MEIRNKLEDERDQKTWSEAQTQLHTTEYTHFFANIHLPPERTEEGAYPLNAPSQHSAKYWFAWELWFRMEQVL